MAIDYHEWSVNGDKKPLVARFQLLKEMDDLSEGYCSDSAVWFDKQLRAWLDLDEICYPEGQISPEANGKDWLRIIHLPFGYVVDASHQKLRDDNGHFIVPIGFEKEKPEGFNARLALDYVETEMQIEAFSLIAREQLGLALAENIFNKMAAEGEGLFQDGELPD